ncbi:hypothetical protein MHU86_12518 [Fragilaria crotonensis]|nr:hypothetical protein MHU86_12518 [Fragilaria crotonensis]
MEMKVNIPMPDQDFRNCCHFSDRAEAFASAVATPAILASHLAYQGAASAAMTAAVSDATARAPVAAAAVLRAMQRNGRRSIGSGNRNRENGSGRIAMGMIDSGIGICCR